MSKLLVLNDGSEGDLEDDVERFWKGSVLVVWAARVTEDEDG